MAWLQNLAGKAENFLNKIDQNAATVLNESTTKISEIENGVQPLNIIEPLQDFTSATNGVETSVVSLNETLNTSPSFVRVPTQTTVDEGSIQDNTSIVSEKSKTSDNDDGVILININNSRESTSPFENVTAVKIFEREYTGLSSISESLQNCSQLPEELQIKYEERISGLESENQELNKQLLNLQHLYREIQNDNGNLQNQVERANDSVKQAQDEMEHYKVRSQRVLQEREKLIALQKDPTLSKVDIDNTVINTYNEELKKEVEFHQEKNREVVEKITGLTKDFSALQQQYVLLQNSNQESKQTLLNNLVHEKKCKTISEEECRTKTKELQSALLNLSEQQNLVQRQYQCIQELKDQLKQRNQFSSSEDVESRLHTLTQTLMAKQSNLETITTERNALRIQLEKLETEYRKLSQFQKTQVCISNVDDSNDSLGRSNVPKLMVVSPFDAGMTRRVKQTYSTLDALSVRTGIFLRRYPLARIFVFCYMVLLHIWVLIILSTYIPSTR